MFLQNSNTAEKVSKASEKVIDNTSYIWDVAYNSINDLLTSIVSRLPYIAAGVVVLVIFWVIAKLAKTIFLTTSKRTQLDLRLRILFSRLIGVLIIIMGVFAALTVIIPNFSFGQLIAGLGFTSFIVGFATKDILNNLLSGVLILWKQPFQIGDYIFIKTNEGKVEYIGVRATRLRMDDGEGILIPNGEMYSNALIIRKSGAARRVKLQISIDYEAKVSLAKEIILSVLEKTEEVVAEPAPGVYVTKLSSDGINLSVYFWVDTEKHSPLKAFDNAASGINRELREAKISLYPPNTVILQNDKENVANPENDIKDTF